MCNKTDARKSCDYCEYPFCEAAEDGGKELCSKELADKALEGLPGLQPETYEEFSKSCDRW